MSLGDITFEDIRAWIKEDDMGYHLMDMLDYSICDTVDRYSNKPVATRFLDKFMHIYVSDFYDAIHSGLKYKALCILDAIEERNNELSEIL